MREVVIGLVLVGCTSGNGSLGGGENWSGRSGSNEPSGGSPTSGGSPSGGGFEAGGAGPMGGSGDASQPPPPMVDAGPTPCTLPADCTAGQVCCGKLNLALANMQCSIMSFDTSCAPSASCPTMASLSCSTQQVRVCATSTDCTEQSFANCCTFSFAMKQATFCVDDVIKQFADTCN